MPKKKQHFVRSSNLNFDQVNCAKLDLLRVFLCEYRSALTQFVDYYWFKHNLDGNWTRLDIQTRGSYYPYPTALVVSDSILSARALKCASNQAMGMINAALRKKQKQMWQLAKMQHDGADPISYKKLHQKISTVPLVKPTINRQVGAELNSINAQLDQHQGSFDLCLTLSALFSNQYKKENLEGQSKIHLPLKQHRRFNHWHSRSIEVMKSFLITERQVSVRFKCKRPEKPATGVRAACDQGMRSLLSVVYTTGQRHASEPCPSGHDLDSIVRDMNNKKRGSKNYQKKQAQRTNYINWCANQLDLDSVDEFVLEKLVNMGYKRRTSSYLRRFTHVQIRSKLQALCEEKGVLFREQSSEYRSQRCSSCGWVHSKNRSAKKFKCQSCGHEDDADFNAATNHLVALVQLQRNLVRGKNKTTGFYWNPVGRGTCSSSRKPKQ